MSADGKAFTERGAYRYLRKVSPSLPAGGEETGKTLAGNHKWHRASKIIGLKADRDFLALGHRILDNVIKSLSLLSSVWFALEVEVSKQRQVVAKQEWLR